MKYEVTMIVETSESDPSVVLAVAQEVAAEFASRSEVIELSMEVDDDDVYVRSIEDGPSAEEASKAKAKGQVVLDIQREEDEYVVAYYLDGKFMEVTTYYTDELEDAIDTQACMKLEAKKAGYTVTTKTSFRRFANRSNSTGN